MAEAGQGLPVHGEDLVALTQLPVIRRLSFTQYRLYEDPDVSLGRVPTSDNGEAEGLLAVALLEDDSVQRVAVL